MKFYLAVLNLIFMKWKHTINVYILHTHICRISLYDNLCFILRSGCFIWPEIFVMCLSLLHGCVKQRVLCPWLLWSGSFFFGDSHGLTITAFFGNFMLNLYLAANLIDLADSTFMQSLTHS